MKRSKRFFATAGEKRKYFRNMRENPTARQLGFVGMSLILRCAPILAVLALVGFSIAASHYGHGTGGTLAAAAPVIAIRELRDKRARTIEEMEQLTAKQPMSPEDRTKWEGLKTEQAALADIIQVREETEALGAAFRKNPDRGDPAPELDDDKKRAKEARDYVSSFWNYMRHGLVTGTRDRGISQREREILSRYSASEQRTTLSGTQTEGVLGGAYPGASSGFFNPVEFVNKVVEAEKWFGGMLGAGMGDPTIIKTTNGNPLPFPTDNDTTQTGELIAENTQVATQGITWANTILGAFKFSSKLVPVSIELLQDSAFDLESYLARKFGQRLGRIKNTKFTIGVGTTEPTGIVTASTAGVTATGDENQTTPDKTQQIGYNDIVGLEHSVDIAYRRNAKWMLHDTTMAALEKMKDKNGRPILTSSLVGVAEGSPKMLLKGYPILVNNDMADVTQTSPVSARKTLLFGALDLYTIRSVMEFTVLRLVERYAEFGVVGFLAFERADGNLLDAGTHPVKYLTNPAS